VSPICPVFPFLGEVPYCTGGKQNKSGFRLIIFFTYSTSSTATFRDVVVHRKIICAGFYFVRVVGIL